VSSSRNKDMALLRRCLQELRTKRDDWEPRDPHWPEASDLRRDSAAPRQGDGWAVFDTRTHTPLAAQTRRRTAAHDGPLGATGCMATTQG